MSLRTRLLLLIVGMVATLAVVLLSIQVNALVSVWLGHSSERALSTAQFVKSFLMERAQERARHRAQLDGEPATLEDRIALWRKVIADDPDLPDLLNVTLVQTRSIVEIAIAGEQGRILVCSNPAKTGTVLQPRLPLKALLDLGPLDRLLQILGGQVDYENRVEIGIKSRPQPVFTVQVLVSSVLLRDAIVPELKRTAAVGLPLFFLSILIAWAAAQLALRPLAGISRTIDDITSGQSLPAQPEPLSSTRELATVQEKLRLLGEQFRGAQLGATQLRGNVELLLERLEEAVLLFDPAGRLQVCGEPAERLLRLPRAQALGRPLSELFAADPALHALLSEALAARRPLRDVRSGHLLVHLDFLPDGATFLRLRDAEGRQLVENQLGLSSRLAAINSLTGRVAHEIKNPLNSITLRLELLRARLLPDLPDAEPELDIIAQEVTRLDRVVRTFLDFTRPVELQSAVFDLGQLAADVVEFIRPEATALSVYLQVEGLHYFSPVRGDHDLLYQAILNVVRNALDAMPNGGTLALRLGRASSEALLDIADTGPGIPEDQREKIFQLYYTTKEKGSGIGLAMTFRALQLHNGGLEVGGELGKGAVFRLRLPLANGDLA